MAHPAQLKYSNKFGNICSIQLGVRSKGSRRCFVEELFVTCVHAHFPIIFIITKPKKCHLGVLG